MKDLSRQFGYNIIAETRDNVNLIILEELGVSEYVQKETERIFEYISKTIDFNKEKKLIGNGVGFIEERIPINIEIFKKGYDGSEGMFTNEKVDTVKTNLIVNLYNFKDRIYYNDFIRKNPIDETNAVSSFNKLARGKCMTIINIVMVVVGGKLSGKFYPTLAHEINHIYQQYMMFHRYGGDQTKYFQIMNDYDSSDKIRKNVARLLYYSKGEEQDSFINDMYADCKRQCSTFDKSIEEVVNDSDAYVKLLDFRKRYDSLKDENDIRLLSVLDNYGFKNKESFLKYLSKSLKRFETKFGKAYIKCKDDFLLKNENISCRVHFGNNNVKNQPSLFFCYKF